jgi:hypothetical protein
MRGYILELQIALVILRSYEVVQQIFVFVIVNIAEKGEVL